MSGFQTDEFQDIHGAIAHVTLFRYHSAWPEDRTEDARLGAAVSRYHYVLHARHAAEEPYVLKCPCDPHCGDIMGRHAGDVAIMKDRVS